MTLLALWQRITGREAAALRHQRDAYADQAGKERQRADTAEQAMRDVVRLGTRDTLGLQQAIWRAKGYLEGRPVPDLAARLDASEQRAHEMAKAALAGDRQRGQTILKLQHRLTRWQRRYRRAMVALHTWRPEAQAWEQRAREAQERANEVDRLLRSLMRGEPGAAGRAANYVAGRRVADTGPETWMPEEQKPDE